MWLTTFFLSPGNMRVVIRSQSLRKQQYPYVEGLRAKSVFFAFFVRPHILAQRRSGSCGGCTMSGSHDRGLRVARQAWLTSLTMVMLLLLPPVRRLVTRLVQGRARERLLHRPCRRRRQAQGRCRDAGADADADADAGEGREEGGAN